MYEVKTPPTLAHDGASDAAEPTELATGAAIHNVKALGRSVVALSTFIAALVMDSTCPPPTCVINTLQTTQAL